MRATRALAASAALLVAPLAVACGGGSSSSATTRPVDTSVDTSTATTATTASPDTTPGSTPATVAVEVGATGFTAVDANGRVAVSAAAELTNTSDVSVGNVQWTAELLDASGTVIADTRGWFSGTLAPGATAWLVPSFSPDAGTSPASVRVELQGADAVEEITVANGTMPLDQAVIEVVSATPTLDINGKLHVEGVFRNPGAARLTTVSATCGLYAGGELVGGTYGYVNEILPGGEAGADMVSNLVPITPTPTDVRCWAGPVNTSTYEPGVTGSGLEVQAGVTYNPAGGQGKFHDTIVGVTIHNPTDQAAFGVHVDVDLLDADGRIVQIASPSETYVLPGETVYTGIVSIMGLDTAPAATAVPRTLVAAWGDPTAASLGSQDGLDLTAYPFDVSGPNAYQSVGMLMFGGTVTNGSGSDLHAAVVSCTARRNGVPVAGASWTLGDTPAGVPTPFEVITGFGAVPTHDEVRCTVHLTAITEIG